MTIVSSHDYPLFDYMKQQGWVKNDADLAKKMSVTPPVLSRIRNGRQPITARLILSIYDNTPMSIEDIRGLIGVRPVK